MTRTWIRLMGVVGLVALPATLLAQSPPMGGEEPPPEETPPASEDPSSSPPVASASVTNDAEPLRPEGFSLGIGAGFVFPADLTFPTVASARFRLGSGLAVEPLVVIAVNGGEETTSFGGIDSTDETSGFQATAGANIRFPLAAHGRVDFLALVGIAASFDTDTNDPEGGMNATTFNDLEVALSYGLGLEYFVKPHFSISADATNPIAVFTRNETDTDTTDTTDTEWLIGAVWDPRVRLMVHLYF